MMLSRSNLYALGALVHLSRHQGWTSATTLAVALDLPYPFLTKILQGLRQKGVIISKSGKNGGFALSDDPGAIRLTSVLGPSYQGDNAPLHLLDAIQDQVHTCLASMSLEDLARGTRHASQISRRRLSRAEPSDVRLPGPA